MARIPVARKTWSADEEDRHLVLLGIEANSPAHFVSLGIKVQETKWNKKNKRVLSSSRGHTKKLTAETEKRLNDAKTVLNKMKYEEVSVDVDSIKKAITGGHGRRESGRDVQDCMRGREIVPM